MLIQWHIPPTDDPLIRRFRSQNQCLNKNFLCDSVQIDGDGKIPNPIVTPLKTSPMASEIREPAQGIKHPDKAYD